MPEIPDLEQIRDVLVVNAMLTGRFQHVDPTAGAKARNWPARTAFVLTLSDGTELRYVDDRFMGNVYLVAASDLDTVPQFAEMGPDAMDPALTEEVFLDRLRHYRGQVKRVLVNAKFIAWIGNAYSDEILLARAFIPLPWYRIWIKTGIVHFIARCTPY